MIEAALFFNRTYGFGRKTIVTGANGAGKTRLLRAIGDSLAGKRSGDPIDVIGSASRFGFAPIDLTKNALRTELLRRFGQPGLEAKSREIEEKQLEVVRIGRAIGLAERAATVAASAPNVGAGVVKSDPAVLIGLQHALKSLEIELASAKAAERMLRTGKCPTCGSEPAKIKKPKRPSKEVDAEIASVRAQLKELTPPVREVPALEMDVDAERARQERLKREIANLKAEVDGGEDEVKAAAAKALARWLPKRVTPSIDLAAGTWLLSFDGSAPVGLALAPTSARSAFAVALACAFADAGGVAVVDDFAQAGMQRPMIKSLLTKLGKRVDDGSIEQAIVVVRPEDLEIAPSDWTIVEVRPA